MDFGVAFDGGDQRYSLTPKDVEDQFRQLLREELKGSLLTHDSLAKQLGMSDRNLQRILSGQYGLKTAVLVQISDILGIDKSRALVAIEKFGNWKYYSDPTLLIAIDLIKPVVDNITRGTVNSLEPLHPKATSQLSNWIAETVIKHQTQLCARREELEVSRQL